MCLFAYSTDEKKEERISRLPFGVGANEIFRPRRLGRKKRKRGAGKEPGEKEKRKKKKPGPDDIPKGVAKSLGI